MSLLIAEPPFQVLPSLAIKYGLNEAIFLQQLHYWLAKSSVEYGGKKWVYNTIQQWAEQFPFWSPRTIERIISSLREKGVIQSVAIRATEWDRTNYFTIVYENVGNDTATLADSSVRQHDVTDTATLADSSSREYIQENTTDINVAKKLATACPHKEIIELYHRHCPTMAKVRDWTDKRAKALQARWRENHDRQTLDFWERFFIYVNKSDFLTGRDGKWHGCNLEWLITQSNFVKVIEGNYENRGSA